MIRYMVSYWFHMVSYRFHIRFHIGFIPQQVVARCWFINNFSSNLNMKKTHGIFSINRVNSEFSGSTLHLEPCTHPKFPPYLGSTPPSRDAITTKITPPKNERLRPLKRDELLVGNTSEPTIDFQGTCVSFQGSITLLVLHVWLLVGGG